MPLKKSKSKKEIKSGKPTKQAVAVAYSIKRKENEGNDMKPVKKMPKKAAKKMPKKK